MNTFKRKALFAAVVAGLGTAASTAEAVYLSPNRTGQALVYPYYTVQSSAGNAYNTYISVVNTTTFAKAVKVRFLEGKTSAEVLDFNLFLSPNDVWVGVVTPSSSATGAPGHLTTPDASCTRPAIGTGQDFRNFEFATGPDALPGTGLDRTREGYVEMLEMGTLSGATATAITHVNNVPANCGVVQAASFTSIPAGQLNPPTGGLMGTGTLINVQSGLNGDYKADALDGWRNSTDYTDSGFVTPRLDDASPTVSLVVRSGDIDPATGASTLITAYRTTFAGSSGATAGAQAVASVFMHSAVMNEYILDNATASLTDWIITQPLKNRFVTPTVAAAPYSALLTSNGACETIGFTFFNREEASATAQGSDFSPLPPGAAANSLCWESTVLAIRNDDSHTQQNTSVSSVVGSVNVTNVSVRPGFQNGWAALTFTGTSATVDGLVGTATRVSLGTDAGGTAVVTAAAPVTFLGLPVTGFAFRTFTNGTLTCGSGSCQGNYGGLFVHSYRTTINP